MFALSHDEFGLKPFAADTLKASPGFWFLVLGMAVCAVLVLTHI